MVQKEQGGEEPGQGYVSSFTKSFHSMSEKKVATETQLQTRKPKPKSTQPDVLAQARLHVKQQQLAHTHTHSQHPPHTPILTKLLSKTCRTKYYMTT